MSKTFGIFEFVRDARYEIRTNVEEKMAVKINRKAVLAMAVLFVGMACTAAVGRIITVDANGTGDYPTIQAEINAGRASARDTNINDSLRIDSNETG